MTGCRRNPASRVPEAELLLSPGGPRVLDVIGADLLRLQGDQLERFDPASGTSRWSATLPIGQRLVQADGRGELWIIDRPGSIADKANLVRIDAARGTVLGTTPLPGGLGQWIRHGDALLRLSDYELARYDTGDGALRWQVADRDLDDSHHRLTREAIWVHRKADLCGFAIADGRALGCLPAVTGWHAAAPDGDLVVLHGDGGLAAHDAATRAVRWRVPAPPGQLFAHLQVTRDRVAAVIQPRGPSQAAQTLVLLRATDGREVWRRNGRPGAYAGYLALAGDLLSWYDSADASQWAVRLPDGEPVRVQQFHEGYVMTIEGGGTAPAVPDGPPLIAGDLVLTERFDRTWVYRIPPR